MSPAPDPRGGLFIDSGDGRGSIHTDDLSDAERAAQGLPAREVEASPAPDGPTDVSTDVTEDDDDGR